MLGEVFYWLFNMSVSASVVGCVVWLLRCVRKLPRRVAVWLWCIPLVRMWLPIGMSSRYGLMALLSRITTRTVEVIGGEGYPAFTMTNYVMGADAYFPIVYKENLLEKVFGVAAVIWAVVAVSAVIVLCMVYAVTLRALRDAEHLQGRVYLSDKVEFPAVYGIFRPHIVIPTAHSEDDLTFVLLHEQAHIRRADNVWRLVALLTACLHWFNPLSWVFLRCFLNDLEQACDESVLSHCPEEQKRSYALSLLSFSKRKTLFVSAFGGGNIRTRIENIVSFKRLSVLAALCMGALVAAIAYILLTNAPM